MFFLASGSQLVWQPNTIPNLFIIKKANKNVSKMYYHEQYRPNNMYKIITKKVKFPKILNWIAF